MIRTQEDYLESLRGIRKRVFMFGEEIDDYVDHPMIRPSLNAVGMTYQLANDPEHTELMTAESNLTGRRVNRFTHLHQNTQDLVNKVKMQRLLGQCTACCFQRCVGMDSFNALDVITYQMDLDLGTEYNQRFRKYLAHVQEENLVVDGAMTDPKGDRSFISKIGIHLHVTDLIVLEGSKSAKVWGVVVVLGVVLVVTRRGPS